VSFIRWSHNLRSWSPILAGHIRNPSVSGPATDAHKETGRELLRTLFDVLLTTY
jgi:hypothetical protein